MTTCGQDILNLPPEVSARLRRHLSQIHGIGSFACTPTAQRARLYEASSFLVLEHPAHGTVRRGHREHIFDPHILRWINHSCMPNARIEFAGGTPVLVAVRDVSVGDEVVVDYRQTEISEEYPEPFICNCGHCAGIRIGEEPE